jgi:acyl-CoA reductase-like NAD-dependent aldehyde dehydrogenase
MFNYGINFDWVKEESDKILLQKLWNAAVAESREGDRKEALNAFKKAYQQIREKQITSRKSHFDAAHQKIEKTLGSFGNLINLD